MQVRGETSSAFVAVAMPLYKQVRDAIYANISGGEWPLGHALPNEVVLAEKFGVSVGTVRRAVEELVESGILTRRQGRGTFVERVKPRSEKGQRSAFVTDEGNSIAYSHRLLSISYREATATEARILGIPSASKLVEIHQSLEGPEGFRGLEVSVIPAREIPDIESEIGAGADLESICKRRGLSISAKSERISVLAADEETSRMLEVSRGNPLLAIERMLGTPDHRNVEYRVGRYALPGHCAYGNDQTSPGGDLAN